MSSDINNETFISVIMPAYNCDQYIEEAINSVTNQTYQNWELLVVDDCSNDKTTQIIEKLSKVDSRIRFYSNKKNQGVSATRNKAISLANGSWLAFLDSDDIWDKTKLEKQINYANDRNAEFIFTGSSYTNEDGEFYPGGFEVPDEVIYEQLRNQNVISCSSVLIKRHFFDTIQMENDEMHEDYGVWLRVLRLGVTAYGINEPLLVYRISRNSKSGNKIKTIKMTYKVFRFIGINPIGSAYFTMRHIMGAFNKYRKIGIMSRIFFC